MKVGGRKYTDLDIFFQRSKIISKLHQPKPSGNEVQLPWSLSRTNSPGPKAGMKPSKPAPDNTGLLIMLSGMAASRRPLKELGRFMS